ncbi:glycosyltransferase [Paracoccus fistulariae]|uniref:Glycosyltransferase n=1 Tax=Paracoccus fistulariae TaxID=658446 RepID=A0ABY7SQ89_9RHOB|nr:glycosyltransferase [Paracoccus fistulariae]MDB6183145.1 glycosyltransferase [Paracoccus fistulariae]WCR09210.1 glycosyltransferase [Paracoccus fistulariae]
MAFVARVLAEQGRIGSANAIVSHVDSLKAEPPPLDTILRPRGVSVIMPTYKGAKRIGRALQSLAAQSIDRRKFEVVIVHNGPDDGTKEVVSAFRENYPTLNTIFAQSAPESAAAARNLGCSLAIFDHMTFLDDDDYLSKNFLEALLEQADGTSVVLSQIVDFDDQGEYESPINPKLLTTFSKERDLNVEDALSAGTALTMTCIKLFPSQMCEQVNFDVALDNGEDVVFWAEVLARFNPTIKLCPTENKAIYYRELRPGSISRPGLSFKFNVLDRLEVIRRIYNLSKRYRSGIFKDKIFTASSFIVAYLKEYPEDYNRILRMVLDSCPDYSANKYINERLSRSLVVSFCFAPWVDTAGVVAAKRMLTAGRPFDVISDNMKKFRNADNDLRKISHHLIGAQVELSSNTTSTLDPVGTMEFARKANENAKSLNKTRRYERMYSRVMWPASNFAAAAIKASLPEISWTAEFSDPMVTDIMSEKRPGKMDMSWLRESGVDDLIIQKGYPLLDSDSLMEWCEYLAYTLADQILFTNKNQRDYMLSQPWISSMKQAIIDRSQIAPHPTPPSEYYELENDEWRPSTQTVNIAYFGSFYKTRGLSSVFEALAVLDDDTKSKLHLDIYASYNKDLEEAILESGVIGSVTQREPLSYFAFLSRCKVYDYLLVNDAETKGIKPLNPYLPSKVSDYLGANVPFWALVEAGSPLSGMSLPNGSKVTALGNMEGYIKALTEMAAQK